MTRAHILVVEDDEGVRELIETALQSEGYEVLGAPHGAAALEFARQRRPDLILLDLRMPVMSGWEFVRAYRTLPGPHAPIVALTAVPDLSDNGSRIDVEACLAKPFELVDLLRLVRRYT